jgi:nucleoid-associated protein YgaU
MMRAKAILISLAVAAALPLLALQCRAHGNEHGEAKASIGSAKVTIRYNRPTLKGRDLMKMIHPGDLWRLGADSPTTIESDSDLDFGGARVPKGEHILMARYVAPGEWTLVVSSKDRIHYEPSAKLAEVPMEVQEGKDPADALAIQLSSKSGHGVIEIAWGSYRLLATFAPAR